MTRKQVYNIHLHNSLLEEVVGATWDTSLVFQGPGRSLVETLQLFVLILQL